MGAERTAPTTILAASKVLPSLVRWLLRFVSFTSLFSIALGCLGLIGWATGNVFLKTVVPGSVPLQQNSAICLVLIGISLYLRKQPPTRGRSSSYSIARALAAIVALVGLLSLGENLFGWNLGIDQLLFWVGPIDASQLVRPGLMSAISAMDFFLLGLALIFLDRKLWGSHWPVQFLCFASGTAAIYGALEFHTRSASFFTRIFHSKPSSPSSCCQWLCCVPVLSGGWARSWLAPGQEARWRADCFRLLSCFP